MANKTIWTRVKEAIRNLSVTVTLIIGFITILGGLTKGVSGFIIQVAGEWHEIRSSPNVQEMAGDIGHGGAEVACYLTADRWEICVAVGVVVVVHYLRLRLVVWPREDARIAYAKAQKQRNPDAHERREK